MTQDAAEGLCIDFARDVQRTVYVTDYDVPVAGKADGSALIVVIVVDATADAEVLDDSTVGEDTEETGVVLACDDVEILNGVALSVEVTSVGSIFHSDAVLPPVADRRPCDFSLAFWYQLAEVDVGCEHGVGLVVTLVHYFLEEYQVLTICQLVDAVNGSQLQIAIVQGVDDFLSLFNCYIAHPVVIQSGIDFVIPVFVFV